MQAVILVGGEGTRLRPLTMNTPKAMVPILNRPYLEHFIEYLQRHGITRILLAMGYLPHRIQAHFDQCALGAALTYVVESIPLGTAGAVRNVAPHLRKEAFFVCNGDIFTDLDLRAMYRFHKERGAVVTIALTPVENPTVFGVVEADAQGRVERFVEKPSWDAVTTNMINAGVYILEPSALELIPPQSHYMFEQGLFPLLLKRGEPVYGYAFDGYWIDLGITEKYLRLHHDLLHKLAIGSSRGDMGVVVEEGCNIHPTAQIAAPVVLGRGCTIGPRVRIIGPTVLGPGCWVGEGAIIEGAVVWSGVHIGAEVRLKDSIVGANCRVGEHCWVVEGCVLGDEAEIGVGNRLGQGIRVWPGKRLEAGTLSF